MSKPWSRTARYKQKIGAKEGKPYLPDKLLKYKIKKYVKMNKPESAGSKLVKSLKKPEIRAALEKWRKSNKRG
jgi:hypothetical protein